MGAVRHRWSNFNRAEFELLRAELDQPKPRGRYYIILCTNHRGEIILNKIAKRRISRDPSPKQEDEILHEHDYGYALTKNTNTKSVSVAQFEFLNLEKK